MENKGYLKDRSQSTGIMQTTPMTLKEASAPNVIKMDCKIEIKNPVLNFDEKIVINDDEIDDDDVELLGVLEKSKEKNKNRFESEAIKKRNQLKEKLLKTPFYNHTKTIPLNKSEFSKYFKKINGVKVAKRPWSGFDYANIYDCSEQISINKSNEELYSAYLNYDLDYIKNNNSYLFSSLHEKNLI